MTTNVQTRKKLLTTANMTRISVLTAIAVILMLVEFLRIRVIPHMYTLDFSNLPVLLGAFAMGPAAGMVILALKEVIHLLLQGIAENNAVGNVADFIMSAAYILPASLLYMRHKTRKNAVLGMALGTVFITVFGVLANWLILLPFYTLACGYPMESIVSTVGKVFPFVTSEATLLIYFVAPFNLVKGIAVSVVTFLIYKPLSPVLHVRR